MTKFMDGIIVVAMGIIWLAIQLASMITAVVMSIVGVIVFVCVVVIGGTLTAIGVGLYSLFHKEEETDDV